MVAWERMHNITTADKKAPRNSASGVGVHDYHDNRNSNFVLNPTDADEVLVLDDIHSPGIPNNNENRPVRHRDTAIQRCAKAVPICMKAMRKFIDINMMSPHFYPLVNTFNTLARFIEKDSEDIADDRAI